MVYGERVPAAVTRIVGRIVEDLRRSGAGAGEGVVVAVGADDPGLVRRLPPGRRVVVAALRGRAPSPFARALLSTAAATVVLDPGELAGLAGAVHGPVVATGIPRPEAMPAAAGLDIGEAGDHLAGLWAAEVGAVPSEGPAVCWVSGPTAVAATVDAWARGAAVVALPGARAHAMMRRGGALMSRTSLEALEATRLLHTTQPLARALARRGGHEAMRLEPIEVVSTRFAEALVLATEAP